VALRVTPVAVEGVVDPVAFLKLAVTLFTALIATEQAPVPLQAPDQPVKVEPEAGAAERETTVPEANVEVQVEPQLIAAGDEVTEPLLLPVAVTVTESA
jgi:hypothetical protein